MAQKSVVLIGDSIRMGYQPYVAELLAGEAEVWGPDENGGNTVNLLTHLHAWARRRDPDVVHVNAGLHDLRTDHYGGRDTIVPLEHYRDNVAHILRFLLEQTDAAVVWATTTPVVDELAHASHAKLDDFDRYDEDVRAFNAEAVEVAHSMNVPVNDLYGIAAGRGATQTADGVHFTADGYRVLGEAVAEAIRPML